MANIEARPEQPANSRPFTHMYTRHIHAQAKDLMAEMLKTQREMSELGKVYDLRATATPRAQPAANTATAPPPEGAVAAAPAPGAASAAGESAARTAAASIAALEEQLPPLPNPVMLAMMRREVLLTKAKLHYLVFQHMQQELKVCACGRGCEDGVRREGVRVSAKDYPVWYLARHKPLHPLTHILPHLCCRCAP